MNNLPNNIPLWRLITSVLLMSVLCGCDSRRDKIKAAEQKGRDADWNYERGDYKAAVTQAKDAVAVLRRLAGSDDPRTINLQYNLASYLHAAGQVPEAVTVSRDVVAAAVRVFGDSHETTLDAWLSLAGALSEIRNSEGNVEPTSAEKSEKLYRETLEVAKKELGHDHHVTMRALEGLSILLAKIERYAEAVQINTQLLEVQRFKLGPEADATLSTRLNLAAALLRQHLPEPAQKEFQLLYEISKRQKGEDHPHTILVNAWIGECLSELGRDVEALTTLKDVWTRRQRVLGAGHRRTLVAGFNLAAFELDRGDRAGARATLTTIHQEAVKSLGPEDSQTQMYAKSIRLLD